MDDAFAGMMAELWADVEQMSVPLRISAATAMVTVAGNILRENMPVEKHDAMLSEMKALLEVTVRQGS
jgi:hypothetical protein